MLPSGSKLVGPNSNTAASTGTLLARLCGHHLSIPAYIADNCMCLSPVYLKRIWCGHNVVKNKNTFAKFCLGQGDYTKLTGRRIDRNELVKGKVCALMHYCFSIVNVTLVYDCICFHAVPYKAFNICIADTIFSCVFDCPVILKLQLFCYSPFLICSDGIVATYQTLLD